VLQPPPERWLPVTGALLLLCGAMLRAVDPALDQRMLDALRYDGSGAIGAVARTISGVGGASVLGPLALAITAWLLWRRQIREALWLVLVVATGRLMVEAAKLAFQMPRPPVSGRLVDVTSWSFPSSHSAGSMLTFLALAMLVRAHQRELLILAIGMAGLVGWSRMALGVHWPSDVAAGLGFGMLWAGAARRWLNSSRFPPV